MATSTSDEAVLNEALEEGKKRLKERKKHKMLAEKYINNSNNNNYYYYYDGLLAFHEKWLFYATSNMVA